MFKDQMQQDVIMVLKFPSNSPVTHVAANTLPHLSIPAAVTVTCSRLFAVNRWHNTVGECVVEKVKVGRDGWMEGKMGGWMDGVLYLLPHITQFHIKRSLTVHF